MRTGGKRGSREPFSVRKQCKSTLQTLSLSEEKTTKRRRHGLCWLAIQGATFARSHVTATSCRDMVTVLDMKVHFQVFNHLVRQPWEEQRLL